MKKVAALLVLGATLTFQAVSQSAPVKSMRPTSVTVVKNKKVVPVGAASSTKLSSVKPAPMVRPSFRGDAVAGTKRRGSAVIRTIQQQPNVE